MERKEPKRLPPLLPLELAPPVWVIILFLVMGALMAFGIIGYLNRPIGTH